MHGDTYIHTCYCYYYYYYYVLCTFAPGGEWDSRCYTNLDFDIFVISTFFLYYNVCKDDAPLLLEGILLYTMHRLGAPLKSLLSKYLIDYLYHI